MNPSLEPVNADPGFADHSANSGMPGKTFFEDDAIHLNNHSGYIADICMEAGIKYNIKPEQEADINKLIMLSSSDDLIMADANENTGAYNIADLLAVVHCPVYLIAGRSIKIENIILTYDGSLSCIQAIKKFSQLFPYLLHLPCHLVHVVSDESDEFPRIKNIKSWLPPLFSNVEFKVLYGDTKDELVNYINQVPGSLAVLGSAKNKFFGLSHKRIIHAVINNGRSDIFVA
jgi:hypothetical protein